MRQTDHGRGDDAGADPNAISDDEVDELLDEVGGADPDDGPDLSDDDVFEVLYNRRRRAVVRHLVEGDGSGSVGDLAERIAADENDTTVRQLSSYERKRVYVALYQNHLPKMDDLGVVDYDKNRGTVRLRDPAERLEPYLGEPDGGDGRMPAAGAVALAGTMLLGTLDVGALAGVTDLLWIGLGLAGIVGLVAAETHGLPAR